MLERRVRQIGTGWSQSRKETGWKEYKKKMFSPLSPFSFQVQRWEIGQGEKKKKQKIKPVYFFIFSGRNL